MRLICCNSRIKSQRIKTDPRRVSQIKPFISKYNWLGINYPSNEK